MSEKILFVDDDPNILNAFQRQLRKQYQIVTASSGREGLEIIQQKGPFSVVVADMRMPEMDGIAFLKKVQEVTPDCVRLMLTGNADQQTAIDAVNKGNVFRFMTKPCPLEQLMNALEAAQNQYRLIHAERELLQGTLNGSIKLLIEILSIVASSVFERALTLRETSIEIARELHITDTWNMEMATMLSDIAYVTLPPETLAKSREGSALSDAEKQIIAHLPEIAHKLLRHIPRLEKVASIILYQGKGFDGSGIPQDSVAGDDIPLESRILKVLHDMKILEDNGYVSSKALEKMKQHPEPYDPRVLEIVTWFFSTREVERQETRQLNVSVSELRPDQVLVANILTVDGGVLLTAGHKLTSAIIEKLYTYHELNRIEEPVKVIIPAR